MNCRLLLHLSLLIIIQPFVKAQDVYDKYSSFADTTVSTALTQKQGYEWLKVLCSMGPRLSGSENLEKAVRWTTAKMESAGLKVWLQPVIVPHWERGKTESAIILSDGEMNGRKLNVAALGGSINTPAEGITAEILEVQSFDELEAKKDQVKGKIVFFSKQMNETIVDPFAAYSDIVQFRSRGAIETGRYGGLGCLIRSITTKYDTVPHVGAIRKYNDSITHVPSAAIAYADAEFLSEALKKNPVLKINLKLDCTAYPDIQSYNVIADLPGKELPNEVVIVAGHLDSWDKGTGAHDDGAGCMQALESIYLLKKFNVQPKRTIRCILFANEENGLRGGIEYGAFADTSSLKHIAAIESDAGGFSPRAFSVAADSVSKQSVLKKINSWLSILQKAGIYMIKAGEHGPADISRIKTAKALIGLSPDSQRYFDLHHSDNDTIDKVNAREMEMGTAAITILAYLLSEEGL